MAAVGPFESAPRIAVGVSGGADSMALCLLLKDWTAAAGGQLQALSVDHGLRPESPAEARRVGRWLARRGVPHRALRWTGPKPQHGVQAAARAARYRLLTGWCAAAGYLHLALAHHRDDQAETVLLRLIAGSGLDGLAGMAGVSELPVLRLIRPLLDVPKAALVATLVGFGQDWIEDPANLDPRYRRGRLRAAGPALEREGVTAARLAATAAKLGRARAALETETAALLAVAAAIHPEGFVRLDWPALMRAPAELARRALARCVMAVGGAPYPPRSERLDRLFLALAADPAGAGRTLGGCRVLACDGRLLLCREAAAARQRLPLPGRRPVTWDGRFLVPPARAFGLPAGRVTVARLGGAGWRAIRAAEPALAHRPVPAAVRPSLPALIDPDGVLAVPHLGYTRRDAAAYTAREIRFAPRNPLAPAAFVVVPERLDTMS